MFANISRITRCSCAGSTTCGQTRGARRSKLIAGIGSGGSRHAAPDWNPVVSFEWDEHAFRPGNEPPLGMHGRGCKQTFAWAVGTFLDCEVDTPQITNMRKQTAHKGQPIDWWTVKPTPLTQKYESFFDELYAPDLEPVRNIFKGKEC